MNNNDSSKRGARRIGSSWAACRHLPVFELLEDRRVPATIFKANGLWLEALEDFNPSVAAIPLVVNRVVHESQFDQLVLYKVSNTNSADVNQIFLLDSEDNNRDRHSDEAEPPLVRDKFGPTIAGPGAIADNGNGGEIFYLGFHGQRFEVDTSRVAAGHVVIKLIGSPADANGDLAPVQVVSVFTVDKPISSKQTNLRIDTTATFVGEFHASPARVETREAWQDLRLRASATDATPEFPEGTADNNQYRVLNAAKQVSAEIDLRAAPRNQRLFGDGLPIGPTDTVDMSQEYYGPTNFDPPNVRIRITSKDGVKHFTNVYIDRTTDVKADNVGVSIGRELASAFIPAGTVFTSTAFVAATDFRAMPFADNYGDRSLHDVLPVRGTWDATDQRLRVSRGSGAAIATLAIARPLPAALSFQATLRATTRASKPMVLFGYQSPTNYKFIQLNFSAQRLVIGYRDTLGLHSLVSVPLELLPNQDYRVNLQLTGRTASVTLGAKQLRKTFAQSFDGALGFGNQGDAASFDDVAVR